MSALTRPDPQGTGRYRTPSARDAEAGITLVELLVSMMLLGLIMAMLTGLYLSATKAVSFGQSMDSNTRVASNAANELSQVLRFATKLKVAGVSAQDPAFLAAERESLTFYSNVNVDAAASTVSIPTKPTKVNFAINASRALVENRWTATASGTAWVFAAPSTPPNSSVALGAGFVGPGAGAPLFSYFDVAGTPIATPVTGSLSAADLARITAVRITVRVQAAAGSAAGPVVVENTITLPNLVTVTP